MVRGFSRPAPYLAFPLYGNSASGYGTETRDTIYTEDNKSKDSIVYTITIPTPLDLIFPRFQCTSNPNADLSCTVTSEGPVPVGYGSMIYDVLNIGNIIALQVLPQTNATSSGVSAPNSNSTSPASGASSPTNDKLSVLV